jgi:hypothetical protein
MHPALRSILRFPLPAALLLAALALPGARAAEAEPVEFFEKRVRPILVDHCYPCHSAAASKTKGGLRLDVRSGWEKGGANGPALIPGKPAESLLLSAVRGTAKDLDPMPPKGDGRTPLSAEQIATLEEWIRIGAPDPRTDQAAATLPDPATHWAFQRPVLPPKPQVRKPDWTRTELDDYVLAGMETHGLAPAPEAPRATLLRRITHDLTGLPPTAEDMARFLADRSPDAYEKAVDRLLSSPRYGERWGRWWLDIARYADSKGYVFEEERRYAYSHTYRDWVVRSINRDLPYDRFLQEQIAGDRLATPEDPWPMAAMGFLTLGRRFLNNEADIIDDRIDVVFRGTQALTVACARCHDHKSDPIPTADYYSLYGVFASSQEPGDKPLLGENPNPHAAALYAEERARREKELADYRADQTAAVLQKLRDRAGEYILCAHETLKSDGSATEGVARSRSMDPGLVGAWKRQLEKAATTHHPILSLWIDLARTDTNDFAAGISNRLATLAANPPANTPFNPALLAGLRQQSPTNLTDLGTRFGRILAAADKAWKDAREEARKNGTPEPTTLADAAQEPLRAFLHAPDSPITESTGDINRFFDVPVAQKSRALKRKLDELDATHNGAPLRAMALLDKPAAVEPVIFKRGNPGNHGAKVPRQFLGILEGPNRKPFAEGSGRLELARALTRPDNPLTARVLVNRVWGRHFGTPLVKSTADFGVRTEPPADPALLDFLAVRFMANGWSLKQLHRDILCSATYRQASDPGDSREIQARFDHNARLDPANTWHWRMNRKRFDFEALRDSLLYVTGSLDETLGGLPVDMFQEKTTPRRTLYGFIDRQNLPGVLRSFDFANPDTTSPQRFQTTVPQQALFMMNNAFLIELARAATTRREFTALASDAQRIRWLYQRVFQRAPSREESAMGLAFVRSQVGIPHEPPMAAAWSYGTGRFDTNNQRVVDFRPFPEFKDNRWQAAAKFPAEGPRSHASISAREGHPGGSQEFSVTRRWSARMDATLEVSGELDHPGNVGDGVRARLVSSRLGLVAEWTAKSSKARTALASVSVLQGDTLDFIVDMMDSENTDSFKWAPVLTHRPPPTAPAGSLTRVWDAGRDFRGPTKDPVPLEPWGKYAQVLLSSNEFVFVD